MTSRSLTTAQLTASAVNWCSRHFILVTMATTRACLKMTRTRQLRPLQVLVNVALLANNKWGIFGSLLFFKILISKGWPTAKIPVQSKTATWLVPISGQVTSFSLLVILVILWWVLGRDFVWSAGNGAQRSRPVSFVLFEFPNYISFGSRRFPFYSSRPTHVSESWSTNQWVQNRQQILGRRTRDLPLWPWLLSEWFYA